MSINLDTILGSGLPNILRINPQNQKIETINLLDAAEILEENIETSQKSTKKVDKALRGSNIDTFG